jgi:ferredoxin
MLQQNNGDNRPFGIREDRASQPIQRLAAILITGIPPNRARRPVPLPLTYYTPLRYDTAITISKENYMAIKIVTSLCPQNHPCPSIRVCPVGAITQKGHGAPDVNAATCIDCGVCARHCGRGALQEG